MSTTDGNGDGSTLVLALGNPLMGDDGFGLAVLEQLRRSREAEGPLILMDGGTWGMSLLPAIEASSRLLLIDAINIGAEPGTTVRLEREQLPRYFSHKISPHQVDLREVLALAELRGTLPNETVAIGVQPENVQLGTTLSPRVQVKVADITDAALRQLSAWGHEPAIQDSLTDA
jgi:hydrogenase maturation protease